MSNTTNYDGNRPVGAFSSLNTWLTYSWINNEHFYQLIPQQYQDLYQRFVKQWFYWYDGFVPYYHNTQSGIMSTHLAKAIVEKLAEKTVGGRLLFNDDGVPDKHSIKIRNRELGSVEFSEYWAKNNNFKSQLKRAFAFAYAGGDSVIKLDTDGKDVYPRVVRKDSYLIDTDFQGHIKKFQCFVHAYTKMIGDKDDESNRRQYYLVEEREWVNGIPKFRVTIKVSNGQNTQSRGYDNIIEDVPFERLPKQVVKRFKGDYPNILLGVWYDIPFKDLGIYMIKATEGLSFLPDMIGGESLLNPIIHILMTYDYYFSSLVTNLYTTRDKVILPQHMQTPNLQDADSFYADQQNWFGGLDSYMFTRIPYVNPEDQKPIFIQPELRDWKSIRDVLLQSVAMILGVDERTISASIIPNSEKPTAREISVDEDTTASFLTSKRDININSINQLFDNVLYFYGFTEECVNFSFSRAGLSNINNVVTVASILKQNNLGDTKSLLEMIWVDKNDKQLEIMMENIKKEMEENTQMKSDKVSNDVEEGIERQNDNTEYHIKKPK